MTKTLDLEVLIYSKGPEKKCRKRSKKSWKNYSMHLISLKLWSVDRLVERAQGTTSTSTVIRRLLTGIGRQEI
ncbi:MAG: hypothetical protein U9R43_10445 [Thermodesulfobacteriota bacterium]|nr:hypothetical protein [Thermodesulfobacteriota bacterium]